MCRYVPHAFLLFFVTESVCSAFAVVTHPMDAGNLPANGSLRVDIEPPFSVAEGAAGRVDGGALRNSGGSTAKDEFPHPIR